MAMLVNTVAAVQQKLIKSNIDVIGLVIKEKFTLKIARNRLLHGKK